MNRHEVTSQLFRSAGYDPTTGVPELEYRNGACRRWLALPAKVGSPQKTEKIVR
ncbi:hypothetical protein ACYAEL_004771 [Enterobacter hormaechei]